MQCASESCAGADCADVQEHHGLGDLSRRPTVKRVLWGGEFWTDGYSVATVGERANWQTVEQYVRRQGQPRENLRQLRMF
ncbi:MAG: transposase [Nitrospira sp.]|nr:transposase [Nitrospira sp.]